MPEKWNLRQVVSLIVIVVILALLGVGADALNRRINPNASSQAASTSAPSIIKSISMKGVDGKTVLDVLKASHQVQTENSSYGTYVTSIDGTAQTDSNAWLFYVDGQLGTDAADKAITTNSQTIEWRYESF